MWVHCVQLCLQWKLLLKLWHRNIHHPNLQRPLQNRCSYVAEHIQTTVKEGKTTSLADFLLTNWLTKVGQQKQQLLHDQLQSKFR